MKKHATPFSKAALKGFALAMALGITPTLYAQVTISGTIYRDANGLTDAAINGTAIGRVITGGLTPGNRIYVYLIETKPAMGATAAYDTVVQQVEVSNVASTRGQYTMTWPDVGNYALAIGAFDQEEFTNPILGFNAQIAPTGEGSTATGDGDPNYSVGINTATNLIVNFGLEERPKGNDVTVSNPLVAPGAAATPAGSLDSLLVPASAFTGADQEDGTYPTGLAGRTVHLLAATGGSLYYNGVLVTLSTLAPSTRITNFDVTKIRFVRTVGASVFSFPYSTEDGATIFQSSPNTITLTAPRLVPVSVSLLSFEARRQGTSAIVQWSAPSEAAGMGFDVERSTDGRNFTTIGHVASVTESNTAVDYRFEDGNMPSTTASGKVYYRLLQTASNGQADYSKVAVLSSFSGSEKASAKLSLYPNPASNVLHVSLNGAAGTTATVVLSDATGRVVDRKATSSEGIATLEVSSLPAGMYFVQYRTENGELIATERIVIAR